MSSNKCCFRAFHGVRDGHREGEDQICNRLEERRLQRRPSKSHVKYRETQSGEIADFAPKSVAYCYAEDFREMSRNERS